MRAHPCAYSALTALKELGSQKRVGVHEAVVRDKDGGLIEKERGESKLVGVKAHPDALAKLDAYHASGGSDDGFTATVTDKAPNNAESPGFPGLPRVPLRGFEPRFPP